jgi:hypothetical protein
MKRMIIFSFLALAVASFLDTPAFAQHGHRLGSSMSHSSSSQSTSSAKGGERSLTQKLTDNTKLADKISKLTGMSATSACQGFKNLGQCVAAAHVAKNLNIPGGFTALKDTMLGISPNGTSTATSKPMTSGRRFRRSIQVQVLRPRLERLRNKLTRTSRTLLAIRRPRSLVRISTHVQPR